MDDELITELVRAGVITNGPGGFFDEHSVLIAQCARALAEYGVEPVICVRSGRRLTGSPT